MIIREANGDDAPEIQELFLELTGDEKVCVLSKRVDEIKKRDDSFLFVVEHNNKIVATAHLTLCPDVMYKNQPYAIAENIIVKPEMQRHGIGKELMSKLEEISKKNNCSKIMLLSSSKREAAHRFFESLGYSGSIKNGFVKYRSTFN